MAKSARAEHRCAMETMRGEDSGACARREAGAAQGSGMDQTADGASLRLAMRAAL